MEAGGPSGDFEVLLADIRHELRTPLTAVVGLSEVLAQGLYGEMNAKQLDAVALVNRAGRSFLAAINAALDLAEVPRGAADLQFESVDVRGLLESTLGLLESKIESRAVVTELSVDEACPTIVADPRVLLQILVNALMGALACCRDGDRLRLYSRAGEQLVIGISATHGDCPLATGAGGRAEGHSVPAEGGAAAELSERWRRAEQLSGWHGASFAIANSPGSTALTLSVHPRPLLAAGRNSLPVTRRVLLVEDDAVIAAMIRDFLSARAYRVTVVADGSLALSQLLEVRPTLVLLALRLPGIDGLEVLRQIRGVSEFSGLPVIVLTALASPAERERCLESGATAYLAKPVRLAFLAEVIEALDPAGPLGGRIPVASQYSPLPAAAPAGGSGAEWPGKPEPRAQAGQLASAGTRLSDREIEVLRLLATGRRNREIAELLCITEAAVKTHVGAVLRKSGAANRAEAVALAASQGLL